MISKKLSMIIHHEEIQLLTKLIQETLTEINSQENKVED